MAIMKNEKYQIYAQSEARTVPLEHLKLLTTSFIDYAALNLGCKVEKADVDRIIEFINNEFSYLPISVIASAFIRGSLGKLKNEKTTLNPRNIYDWLSEVSLDYKTKLEHNERDARLSQKTLSADLIKTPFGQALRWKIDHLTEEDWDKAPLKEVATMIGRGQIPTLENFGIKNETNIS